MKQEEMKEKWKLTPPDTTTDHGGCHDQLVVVATTMVASPSPGSLVFVRNFSVAAHFLH